MLMVPFSLNLSPDVTFVTGDFCSTIDPEVSGPGLALRFPARNGQAESVTFIVIADIASEFREDESDER
jgi:hypothetical protein